MAHELEHLGGVTVIRPLGAGGRLDSTEAPALEAAVRTLLEGDTRALVFDLSRVSYISSAGLRVVLLAGRTLRPAGGKLALAGVRGVVREVFEMSGFLKLFPEGADAAAAAALIAPG